ncbi:MAG: NTP transferase domain-containing protein [Haloarculaceae archaeon]
MCGGRGTRLDAAVEKPLLAVGGEPLVDRVCGALAASSVDATYAVVSPHAPETAAHVRCPTVETPGEGYVADLDVALADDRISTPVLTVAADLPLLAPEVVDDVLAAHEGGSLTVAVPAALKRVLGVSADTTVEVDGRDLAPTGVNVVADAGEGLLVSHDVRLAINVNRRDDAAVAERLL